MEEVEVVEGVYISGLNNSTFVWNNIPSFAVITGVNGAGKSRAIKALFENIGAALKDSVVYVDDHYRFDQNSSSGSGLVDLNYLLRDRAALDQTIFKIRRNVDAGVSFIDDDDYVHSCVSVLLTKIEKSELKKGEITDAQIREIVLSHVQYEKNLKNSLKQPLMILAQVFSDYHKRVTHNLSEIRANLNAYMRELFEFYNQKFPQPLSHEDFISTISNHAFFDELLESYQKKLFKNSPLDMINGILGEFGFKYRIAFEPKNNRIKLVKDNLELNIHELSSGEKLILGMMSWLFYTNGMGEEETIPARASGKGIKVLLLDEPDKHLDPNLCKLFFDIVYEVFVKKHHIQVIMSSHRVDTVSLAPLQNIFVMRQGGQVQQTAVERVHKLRALMRMTTNVREIVDYEHRVYAESTSDMLFYQGVYSSLRGFSDRLRSQKKLEGTAKHDRHYWQVANQSFRLLSRRYRIGFYTASKKEKADGGCTKVLEKVESDKNAISSLSAGTSNYRLRPDVSAHWRQQKHILNSPRFFQPFGFVDNDYKKNYQLPQKELTQNIVVMSDRHSLENYILDPVILCSVLAEGEIDNLIEGSNLRQSKNAMVPDFEYKKNRLKIVCKQIKKLLKTSQYHSLQEHIDTYFLIVAETIVVVHGRMDEETKPEGKIYYDHLKLKMAATTPELILATLTVEILNATTGDVFELLYPDELLKLRGHDLEDKFLGNKNRVSVTNTICERVFDRGIEFIPLDLARMFFELNDKVRSNVLPAFN